MTDKSPGTVSPFDAIRLLKTTLPPPPYMVQHVYDISLSDDSFWLWWEVAGVHFGTEAAAKAFLAVLESVR